MEAWPAGGRATFTVIPASGGDDAGCVTLCRASFIRCIAAAAPVTRHVNVNPCTTELCSASQVLRGGVCCSREGHVHVRSASQRRRQVRRNIAQILDFHGFRLRPHRAIACERVPLNVSAVLCLAGAAWRCLLPAKGLRSCPETLGAPAVTPCLRPIGLFPCVLPRKRSLVYPPPEETIHPLYPVLSQVQTATSLPQAAL